MKRSNLKILTLVLIFQILIIPNCFIIFGNAATGEIIPEFGDAPVINGDLSDAAWDDAYKTTIFLDPILSTDLWVLQANSHLYIAISLELVYTTDDFFLGILISNSSSCSMANLKDAKIIQHTNLSSGEFNYLDYSIDNNIFTEDFEKNGDGATINSTDERYYEFSIPIGEEDSDDVNLQYGESYCFNISLGTTDSYPDGILKSAVITIAIQTPPPPMIDPLALSLLIIAIVISSITAAFLVIYTLKTLTLKKKIKRIIR